MAQRASDHSVVRLADLVDRKGIDFDLRPDDTDAMAERLELLDLRKVRFTGSLRPEGSRGWRMDATLGATVVQPCVVTLAPVTTRIDDPVLRRYTPDFDQIRGEDTDREAEGVPMPEDDSLEPLPAAIDLKAVMEEALALSLPQYPRADGAELGDARYTEKGVAPLSEADLKPFAGLAALRDKMGGSGEGGAED